MNDRAHKSVVAVIAVVAVLWTVAAVATLVYWSGLAVWACAAVAAVAFAWILRVYLRPTTAVAEVEVSRQSASR
jgi:hypothetical protein